MLIVPNTVAPEAGEVMLTVGGVLSGGGHVKPGIHGRNCANARDGIQVKPSTKRPVQTRFAIFSIGFPFFTRACASDDCARQIWRRPRPSIDRLNYDPLGAASGPAHRIVGPQRVVSCVAAIDRMDGRGL